MRLVLPLLLPRLLLASVVDLKVIAAVEEYDISDDGALSLLQRRAEHERLPWNSSDAAASLLQAENEHDRAHQNPTVDLRPGQGGPADVVEFGVLVKGYGGIDLKTSSWSSDLVISARWLDARAAALVPSGSTSITLPTVTASAQMWLPDLILSNRAKGGVEIISSSISVASTGIITKTERMLATLRASLDLRAFPFDAQTLNVVVASSTLMFDELKLMPLVDVEGVNLTDVNPGIFEGKDFMVTTFNASEYEETDGSLRKSRGVLAIEVKREAMPLFQTLVMPQLLLLLVSWSVFWFPLQPAFVMPRVATGALALVSLMAFSSRIGAAMPPDAGLTWVDVFSATCQYLMIWAMILNIFIDIVKEMHLSIADRMDTELKFMFGLVAGVAVLTLLCNNGAAGNYMLSTLTKVEVFGSMVPYMLFCIWRARNEASKDKAASGNR